jgi:hypothetical protein
MIRATDVEEMRNARCATLNEVAGPKRNANSVRAAAKGTEPRVASIRQDPETRSVLERCREIQQIIARLTWAEICAYALIVVF